VCPKLGEPELRPVVSFIGPAVLCSVRPSCRCPCWLSHATCVTTLTARPPTYTFCHTVVSCCLFTDFGCFCRFCFGWCVSPATGTSLVTCSVASSSESSSISTASVVFRFCPRTAIAPFALCVAGRCLSPSTRRRLCCLKSSLLWSSLDVPSVF
jgi:hypothetical protein